MRITDYRIIENEKDILPTAEDFAYRNCYPKENPDGHYHGNLNISHREPFNNYQEAYDYIKYHTKNSIYYDMAVRFYDTSSIPSIKKQIQLQEKIEIKKQKLNEYIQKNKLTSRKSTFFGCPNCKSKITRQYFENQQIPERIIVNCPVCQTDLRSEKILKKIKNFEEKILELNKELTIEKCKPHTKGPARIKWLVKLEVHV